MTKNRTLLVLRVLSILIVIALAGSLRLRAVDKLGIDFDEDDYLRAGQEYAQLIRAGDWAGFTQANYRPEHPPLAKILIGISILSAPPKPLTPEAATSAEPNKYLPRDLVDPARLWMAALGTLTVAILAVLDPLGGLLLAGHTFTIKYVSQIMLEALPALTSLLSVLAYLRWKKTSPARFNGWLALSAALLGLTAASKYLYAVAGLAILVDWFLDARHRNRTPDFLKQATLWGLLALLVFFAADPYLWPDPVGRLRESVFYHAAYSTGAEEVQETNWPFWQPLFWLSWSPYWWHEGVFPFPFDILIFAFALLGFKRLWERERTFALWMGLAVAFLLVWPTKWPQYVVTLSVPLSLAGAEGLRLVGEELASAWRGRRDRPRERSDLRRALPWLVPGLLAFILLTLLPLIFEIGVSMTDFSSASIRDGFNGGLWRAISGGLTGRLPIVEGGVEVMPNKVGFTGLTSYPAVLDWITANGILFFNVFWTVTSVALQTALGLGVALLLRQRGVWLGKFWQALFILPWAIPEMIGAVMWFNIFQYDSGWLALAAVKFGPDSFLGAFYAALRDGPSLWLIAFLLPAMWYGFPFMMLASSVGLKAIPRDVFDAAAIDGAAPWQAFRYVTWPLLLPLLLPALIVRGIFAFNQFYLFQVFYFGDATLAALSYNVFNPNAGFGPARGGQFAISAVINIITVLILVIFVMLFNRLSKASEGVTYA